MKKVLRVTDLEGVKSRASKNALIVLGRSDKGFWVQNLELIGGQVIPDHENDEVTIKFKLNAGQFIVMQDEPEMAGKKVYDHKTRTWEIV